MEALTAHLKSLDTVTKIQEAQTKKDFPAIWKIARPVLEALSTFFFLPRAWKFLIVALLATGDTVGQMEKPPEEIAAEQEEQASLDEIKSHYDQVNGTNIDVNQNRSFLLKWNKENLQVSA